MTYLPNYYKHLIHKTKYIRKQCTIIRVCETITESFFAITAADVVPCGGPPRTSFIVQIILSFWSFEISDGILRNQKIIIDLDSFSYQGLICLAPFLVIIVFVSTILLKLAKLQLFSLAQSCQLKRLKSMLFWLFSSSEYRR